MRLNLALTPIPSLYVLSVRLFSSFAPIAKAKCLGDSAIYIFVLTREGMTESELHHIPVLLYNFQQYKLTA